MRRPAAAVDPRDKSTRTETSAWGITRVSHFSETSYIQYWDDSENKWCSLANFAKSISPATRREVGDKLMNWIVATDSISKDEIHAKRAALLSKAGVSGKAAVKAHKPSARDDDDSDDGDEDEDVI